MTYKEYVEWEAFYSIEPFPEERQDFRNALLVSIMVNLQRGKNDKAVEIEDFIPDFWSERKSKKQTPQEMLMSAKMISAMIGEKKGG